jgi:prostatic aicd phosphatase
LALAAATGAKESHPKISSVGAGFIGAGVTIALALSIIGLLLFLGVIGFGRARRAKKRSEGGSDVSLYIPPL